MRGLRAIIQQRGIKLAQKRSKLFVEDILVCFKYSTKKVFKIINNSKTGDYKLSSQNLITFMYPNNKKKESGLE